LTRLEEILLRETITEINKKPLMKDTEWCKQYLAYHADHRLCPHFPTCLIWWRVSMKCRLGQDLAEIDFLPAESEKGDLEV
jgi:hypothetical protein